MTKHLGCSWMILTLTAVLLNGCGGGSSGQDSTDTGHDTDPDVDHNSNLAVDPADANALSEVLIIPGSTVKEGQLPAPSVSPDRPTVERSEETLAYSPGSQITLPIDYRASSGVLDHVLVAVAGATRYFETPLPDAGTSGTFVLPVELPQQVEDGNFCLNMMLVDSTNQTSDIQDMCVSVVQPLACDVERASGGEGITSTLHQMDGNSGSVRVQYQTYTVKDKVDVFQNGTWVAGTGPITNRASIRTALNCADATEDLGYVGEQSEFLFSYDPSLGGDVEVVVSGCERNGTRWNYTASCPRDYGGGAIPSGAIDFSRYILPSSSRTLEYERYYVNEGNISFDHSYSETWEVSDNQAVVTDSEWGDVETITITADAIELNDGGSFYSRKRYWESGFVYEDSYGEVGLFGPFDNRSLAVGGTAPSRSDQNVVILMFYDPAYGDIGVSYYARGVGLVGDRWYYECPEGIELSPDTDYSQLCRSDYDIDILVSD